MSLHWFDTLSAAVLIFFAAAGAWRGFVREIFPALSLLGGGASAAALQETVSGFMAGYIKAGLGRDLAAYAAVFLLVWGVIALAGVGVRKLSGNYESVTIANHVAGFILGVGKAAMAMAIIVVLLGFAPSMKKDIKKSSVSGPYLSSFTDFTLETLSPGLAAKLNDPEKSGILEKAGNIKKAVEELQLKGGKEQSKPSSGTK